MLARRHQAGFTLMEMVISVVVLGLLSVVMTPLMSLPATAYMDAQRRVRIQNQMQLIRSKLNDDLQYALPGSLRRTNLGAVQYLEYLEIRAYGRLRTEGTCGVPVPNAFRSGCAIATFDTLGPLTYLVGASAAVPNSDYVAVLASAYPPYQTVAGQRPMSRLTSATTLPNGVRLTFAANNFPATVPSVVTAASKRVYIVAQPVTYRCDPGSGKIEKFSGYTPIQNQPTNFGAAVPALVSDAVSQCLFNVDPPMPAPGVPRTLKSVASFNIRLSSAVNAPAGQPAEFIDGLIQIGVREP